MKEHGKRTILIILLSAALLVILLVLWLLLRTVSLGSRLSYDASETEPVVIDAAYAAGYGIYYPKTGPIHDSKIVNILFLGTDYQVNRDERGRADANILCSLNTRSGEIRLVSFERGIGVPVPGRGTDLLTHAYHWGGAKLSQSILSQMFSVDIKAYVQVDFESFAELIDAVGGIDVELTETEAKALNGEVPTQVWAWGEVHEGWNRLSGHDALQYCRLRSIDSDWNRQRRQRTVLEQVQKKCRKMPVFQLLGFAEDILPLIHTNLSREDFTKLMFSLPKMLHGTVTQLQVPDRNGSEGTIRCVPDYEARKIANFLYDAGYELKSPY